MNKIFPSDINHKGVGSKRVGRLHSDSAGASPFDLIASRIKEEQIEIAGVSRVPIPSFVGDPNPEQSFLAGSDYEGVRGDDDTVRDISGDDLGSS
jgi:hypothetical protein